MAELLDHFRPGEGGDQRGSNGEPAGERLCRAEHCPYGLASKVESAAGKMNAAPSIMNEPGAAAPRPERRTAQGILPRALDRAQNLYVAGGMTVAEITGAACRAPGVAVGHWAMRAPLVRETVV